MNNYFKKYIKYKIKYNLQKKNIMIGKGIYTGRYILNIQNVSNTISLQSNNLDELLNNLIKYVQQIIIKRSIIIKYGINPETIYYNDNTNNPSDDLQKLKIFIKTKYETETEINETKTIEIVLMIDDKCNRSDLFKVLGVKKKEVVIIPKLFDESDDKPYKYEEIKIYGIYDYKAWIITLSESVVYEDHAMSKKSSNILSQKLSDIPNDNTGYIKYDDNYDNSDAYYSDAFDESIIFAGTTFDFYLKNCCNLYIILKNPDELHPDTSCINRPFIPDEDDICTKIQSDIFNYSNHSNPGEVGSYSINDEYFMNKEEYEEIINHKILSVE